MQMPDTWSDDCKRLILQGMRDYHKHKGGDYLNYYQPILTNDEEKQLDQMVEQQMENIRFMEEVEKKEVVEAYQIN